MSLREIMQQLNIEVTKEDIENGRPNNPWYCPIAVSLRRLLPTIDPRFGREFGPDFRVGSQFILVENTDSSMETTPETVEKPVSWLWFKQTEESSKFVIDFDNGKEVQPLVFKVELTDCLSD
jgi:hypothetical protein